MRHNPGGEDSPTANLQQISPDRLHRLDEISVIQMHYQKTLATSSTETRIPHFKPIGAPYYLLVVFV